MQAKQLFWFFLVFFALSGLGLYSLIVILPHQPVLVFLLYTVLGLFASFVLTRRCVRLYTEQAETLAKMQQWEQDTLAALEQDLNPSLEILLHTSEQLVDIPQKRQDRRCILSLHENAACLSSLFHEFLDCRRVESGRERIETKPFALYVCVEQVLARLIPQASKRGIQLILAFDPHVPYKMRGDARRTEQILYNLLDTSLRRTGSTWIELSVSPVPSGQAVQYHIRDCGMSRSLALQSSQCTDQSQGKGFALSYRLIHLLGGEVQGSKDGTSFSFTLPLLQAEEASNPPPWLCSSVSELLGLNIALIIDNIPLEEALSRHLRFLGLHTFSLPASRLDSLNPSDRLDLIILDNAGVEQLDRRRREQLGKLVNSLNSPAIVLGSTDLSPDFFDQEPVILNKPVLGKALFYALTRSSIKRMQPARCHRPFILLAEDNRTSQLLITSLLKDLGCRVDSVENGAEAVEAVQGKDYDILFMDVNMPILGGKEASQRIRENMPKNKQPLIVAISADVSPHNISQCRQAGMDDFVGHPCTRAEFERILALWEGKEGVLLPTAAPVPSPALALVDREKFEELCQLSDEISDPEKERSMIEELFFIYHEQAEESLAQMTAFVEQKDYTKLTTVAHKFRGLCLNLGLNVLAALARDMEHQSSTNHEDIPQILEQIKDCLQQTNKHVEELFRFEK